MTELQAVGGSTNTTHSIIINRPLTGSADYAHKKQKMKQVFINHQDFILEIGIKDGQVFTQSSDPGVWKRLDMSDRTKIPYYTYGECWYQERFKTASPKSVEKFWTAVDFELSLV